MDDVWVALDLHLSDEKEDEEDHVDPEETGEIPFCTNKVRIDDTLKCSVLLNIVPKRIIDI